MSILISASSQNLLSLLNFQSHFNTETTYDLAKTERKLINKTVFFKQYSKKTKNTEIKYKKAFAGTKIEAHL